MEGIIALSIPIAFLVCVALVARWLSDNRVRRELNNSGASPEMVAQIMQNPVQDPLSSLKWGIVAISIGVALAGIQLLGLGGEDPMAFGLVFILGGAGLLLFYRIAARKE